MEMATSLEGLSIDSTREQCLGTLDHYSRYVSVFIGDK
jgi:hypothetical protein